LSEATGYRRQATGVAIVIILAAAMISLNVRNHVDRRPNVAMRDTLSVLRAAIADYAKTHGHYPHALRDLVSGGELGRIPTDPVTGSSRTWRLTTRETVRVDDFQSTTAAPPPSEIVDVHSGAIGRDASGKAWSDY
jgi:general secretion pathway protein G